MNDQFQKAMAKQSTDPCRWCGAVVEGQKVVRRHLLWCPLWSEWADNQLEVLNA